MKRILTLTLATLILCLIATAAHAGQRMSVWASRNHACKMKRGTFVVPPGRNATNFQVTMSSSWLPCGGASTPTLMGVRIPGFFYRVQYYNGKTETRQGNLATLTLGPGTYTVEVPDGGMNTKASVSYELTGGAAPKPPAAASAAMGDISGAWSDPTTKSKAQITQTGNSMSITNTFMWQGRPVTWAGSGRIKGATVTFHFHYTQNQPEKWEDGTMNLTLTGPGILSGSWTTKPSGYTQKITLVQKKKKKKKAAAAPQAPAPKKPTVKPAAPQKNPCGPNEAWQGGNVCIPPPTPYDGR